ncbi:MAG: hypothetical protein J2P20_11505 [Pseudonocardia sp.]|nr:hypothetical protein [Pseudonocardia sp.]
MDGVRPLESVPSSGLVLLPVDGRVLADGRWLWLTTGGFGDGRTAQSAFVIT